MANNCKLNKLPPCYDIVTLDIRNNLLEDLSAAKAFRKMEHLCIQDNKLKIIYFDRDMFPSLKKLEFGSTECKFISFSVVHDMIYNNINVNVSTETNLLLPPRSAFQTLGSYIEDPEIYVNKSEALFWLIYESKKRFQCISHSIGTKGYCERNRIF